MGAAVGTVVDAGLVLAGVLTVLVRRQRCSWPVTVATAALAAPSALFAVAAARVQAPLPAVAAVYLAVSAWSVWLLSGPPTRPWRDRAIPAE